MNPEKQKGLEAAGWMFGDAEDFLRDTQELISREQLEDRVAKAAASLVKAQQYRYVHHARSMRRRTGFRRYVASRLRSYREAYVKAWLAMPEVRFWPECNGNKTKGIGRYLKHIREVLSLNPQEK